MDEVGRGALAGPLTAAAVVFRSQLPVNSLGLRDSKKLTAKQREELYKEILEKAEIVEIEMITVRKINNKGIGWANKEIFRNLIKRIKADQYIVDGNLKIKKATSLIRADAKIPEVMAASIVAKVTRDRLMRGLHEQWPNYGWKTNVGYGTRLHIEALREIGVTQHHRKMFVETALGLKNTD